MSHDGVRRRHVALTDHRLVVHRIVPRSDNLFSVPIHRAENEPVDPKITSTREMRAIDRVNSDEVRGLIVKVDAPLNCMQNGDNRYR